MKYYWMLCSFENFLKEKAMVECVSTKHPFEETKQNKLFKNFYIRDVTLLNWREISKEEFELFNKP